EPSAAPGRGPRCLRPDPAGLPPVPGSAGVPCWHVCDLITFLTVQQSPPSLLLLLFLRLFLVLHWRRLLPVLGPVLSSELFSQFRVTHEALRVGAVGFFAPVSLLLELGSKLPVTLRADLFGHAMFVAPPAAVVVFFLLADLGRLLLRASALRRVRLAAAEDDKHSQGE